MWVWWLLLAMLLAAICWLFWAPIRLEINTWKGIYQMEWKGIGDLVWLPDEGLDVVETRIFFWKKRWVLSKMQSRKKRENAKQVSRQKLKGQTNKKGKSGRSGLQMAKKMLRTFRVRQCRLWLDTGDYLWNAWLFPVGWLSRNPHAGIWINFQGKNEGILLVENRLGRLLWAVISSRVR